MAEEAESGGDRTEAATQRHADQAREAGQVPMSRELVAFLSLGAVGLTLNSHLPDMTRRLLSLFAAFLSRSGQDDMISGAGARATVLAVVGIIVPVVGTALFTGAAAVLIQTKFLLHIEALAPQISRVSPMRGLHRVFGFNGVVETVKSVAKLGIVVVAVYVATIGDLPSLITLPTQDPEKLLSALALPVLHLCIAAVATQGMVAGADLMWVRFRHARDLRMSKQDIRDELKDTEGNPHVKARLRRIRIMRARKRMMSKIPTATVVVTNPTHYAVALAYDRATNPAPRIVAKGADAVAARIREVARLNNVPIVANPPLTRALYRLDIDVEIPAEHYKAVAEIIAYVWRLRQPNRTIS